MGHNRAGDRVKAKERRIRKAERRAEKKEKAKGSGIVGAVKAAVRKIKEIVS